MTRERAVLTIPIITGICWTLSFLVAAAVCADETVVVQPRTGRRPAATGSADRIASPIRVNSHLVLVPATVTDRADQTIIGLDAKDFQLFDDKVERPITQFALEDAPVSIVVLFDCSASMAMKQREARMAVSEFLRVANPDDEFALLTFNNCPRLAVNFTKQTERIGEGLMAATFVGQTALLDAICLALNAVKKSTYERKALFIVSDGGDNDSRYTKKQVTDRVREADTQIYSIAVVVRPGYWKLPSEEAAGPALLDEMAKLSGGRSFEISDLNDLPRVGAKIGSYLRNQYVLGFSPAPLARAGKYHRIDVKMAPGSKSTSLRVRSRSGYFAPGP